MKIGIYRTCGIGDAVQLTPLFQQIKADLPQAAVTFFTSANVAGIVRPCPWLDTVFAFDSRLVSSRAASWGGFPLWRQIAQRGRWDIFIDLDPKWRRSLFLVLVPAQIKAGLQTEGWKPLRLFDKFAPLRRDGRDVGHASARYLDLWRQITGFADRGFGYDVTYLLDSKPGFPDVPDDAVCLAPGAGNAIMPDAAKRWPFASWLRLAETLTTAGLTPVWLGSKQDALEFSHPGMRRNLMGQLDLVQTCHVIHRSRALIGNDSGPFHLALGLHRRATAFFGPTNPQHTGPFRSGPALVFKAGYGRVPTEILADDSLDPDRDPLQQRQPMDLLKPEQVVPDLLKFLNSRDAKGRDGSP